MSLSAIYKIWVESIAKKMDRVIKGNVTHSGFWRQVSVLAGGTAMAQVLVILSLPILTRLYSPADFGVLQAYVSLTAIILVVTSWRYEYAIVLPKDDGDAAHLFVLSGCALIITTVILSVLIFLPNSILFNFSNIDSLRPYVWLIPIGVIGGGGYNILNYWAIRRNQYSAIALTQFGKSLGQVITQIALGVLTFGTSGLLLGDVIGKTSGSLTLYTKVWRKDQFFLSTISLCKLKDLAWRYRRFPLISTFSSLINSLSLNLPALLLLSFYGPQVVGWFALGQRAMNVPLSMIGKAVAQVYLGQAADLAHQGYHQLRRFYLKTALRLFLIGMIPIGLISLIGPWLFILVFGESWKQAGVYIQLLFFASIAKFVVNPISQTLIILERQVIQLMWDVGRLSAVIISFGVPMFFNWPDTYAIGLYSITSSLAYVVLFFMSIHALNQNHALTEPKAKKKSGNMAVSTSASSIREFTAIF